MVRIKILKDVIKYAYITFPMIYLIILLFKTDEFNLSLTVGYIGLGIFTSLGFLFSYIDMYNKNSSEVKNGIDN